MKTRRTPSVLQSLLIMTVLLTLSGFAFSSDSNRFKAELSGAEEVPPVATETTGEVNLKINRPQTIIKFELEIEDATDILGAPALGAHIHCAPAGENGPVVAFLAGEVSGGFDGEVEIEAALTDANIVDDSCGETIADLVQSMRDGNTYVNVHSPAFPGGEIRGQIREK